jgi:hypothetical protein
MKGIWESVSVSNQFQIAKREGGKVQAKREICDKNF